MFFRQTRTMLKKLYAEGGIEICTPSPDEANSCLPENLRPVLIRTLIQPDADVLMSVAGDALGQPDIWDAHQEKLARNLEAILSLRRLIRRFWLAIRVMGVLFLILSGYGAYEGQLTLAAFGLGMSMVFFLLRLLPGFFIRQYLKRKANFS